MVTDFMHHTIHLRWSAMLQPASNHWGAHVCHKQLVLQLGCTSDLQNIYYLLAVQGLSAAIAV